VNTAEKIPYLRSAKQVSIPALEPLAFGLQPCLKAPFPWFGGKSRCAHLVWERFGDVPNYVEPFYGSGAVLLGRPFPPRIETGICQWIGSGWCKGDHNQNRIGNSQRIGVHAKRADLKRGGHGVHRTEVMTWTQRPVLDCAERGMMVPCGDNLRSYFLALQNRLRRGRVCCGDWKRILGPSPTFKIGVTGVFLDPPYSDLANRDKDIYSEDSLSVAHDVREWAIANGDNKLLRIALCGYEGEHDMPATWDCVAWKGNGGYANANGDDSTPGTANAHKERIWFSPHCLPKPQPELWEKF